MELLPFFEWCESTFLGQTVRTSVWLFPVIEAIHLLGLSLLGGMVLALDLRMLGVAMRDQPIAMIARGTYPWLARALVLMLVTGVLLFLSEAVKCYHNPSFWVKMTTLPFAIAFALTVRKRVAFRDGGVTGWQTRLTAGVSIALWFVVAAAGRWIGFSS